MLNSTDVFVIGGGPAGLAAAVAARRRGFRVMLADGAEPPIDKACGEALLPDGVEALERLGIQIPSTEAWSLRGIRFLSASRSADARFTSQPGIAIRRTALHGLMSERAEQLGVQLFWQTAVKGISHEEVELEGRRIRTRWIIGADGANSRVRRWAGLDVGPRPRLRFAFRQHFRVKPWTDHVEVYWGDRCQGYATAVSREQVCVALASHDSQMRLEEGLNGFAALRANLAHAEVVSSERGAITGNRQFRRVSKGRVALIGDASGTVDAITGEGMGLAFCQAVALAEALQNDDPASYQREHRRLSRRPLWMARLMLTLDRRPRLQERTLEVFQKHPEVFRRLVELHVGILPPSHIVKDGLTLGWGLLRARS